MAYIAAIAAGGAEAIKAYQTNKLKQAEAEAYRDAKNRGMAATTRDVAEADRRKELMESRAIALAASQGGGIDDPGMVNLIGDLNAEGEYHVMARLWRGQDEAAGNIHGADSALREGKMAIKMAPINAITSAFSAYGGAGGFS